MASSTPLDAAFRDLERSLVRRRLSEIDVKLRIEIIALAALIDGFLFWQTRVPLDALATADGPVAAAGAVAAMLGFLALAAGWLAGSHHLAQLRTGPPGPAWLAVPVPPQWIARHLAWEARARALWVAGLAPGVILAAVGLVPAWWLGLLAAAFVWILLEAGRLGCAIGYRLATRGIGGERPIHPLVRTLAKPPRMDSATRRSSARWRRMPAWRALWHKDLVLTLRPTLTRRRLALPIVLGVLSVMAWGLPTELAPRLFAFALTLLTATTLAEWLLALAGQDPFDVMRGLPIGVTTLWLSRAAWVALGSTALVFSHALAARSLPPPALHLYLIWIGCAALAIGVLAVNYGITLFPRADVAERLLLLALGLSVAASLMIPLLGWLILITAVFHSARRLPRWSWLEEHS